MMVVDAHEDLAWNVINFGRDYTRPVSVTRALEQYTHIPVQNGSALLGWDDWIRGQVGIIFATLFASPGRWRYGEWDCMSYSDPDGARRVYLESMDVYDRMFEKHPDKFILIKKRGDLRRILSEREARPDHPGPIGLVLLMEGSEAIQQLDEVMEWFERGVRIASLSWAGNQYAGGTREPGPITEAGFALMERMADLGMMLDVSHLIPQGVLQAVDAFPGTILASHSNPRARIPGHSNPERHLTDEAILRIVERDGVIGTVVYNPFITNGWDISRGREEVPIEDLVATVDYVCQLVGDADHVGFGSDLEGGFGLEQIPHGLDSVADLQKIGTALANHGYSQEDIEGVLGKNWIRLLEKGLPEK